MMIQSEMETSVVYLDPMTILDDEKRDDVYFIIGTNRECQLYGSTVKTVDNKEQSGTIKMQTAVDRQHRSNNATS